MLHVEHELLDWQKALVKVKVVRAAGRAAVAHSPVQNRPLPPPPCPPYRYLTYSIVAGYTLFGGFLAEDIVPCSHLKQHYCSCSAGKRLEFSSH